MFEPTTNPENSQKRTLPAATQAAPLKVRLDEEMKLASREDVSAETRHEIKRASLFPVATHPLLVTAGFIVLLWGIVAGKDFLVPVFVSTLLAMLMIPSVRFLRKLGAPEWLAATVASVLLILPLVMLASLIVSETEELITAWPALAAATSQKAQAVLSSPLIAKYGLADHLSLKSIETKLGQSASDGFAMAFGGLKEMFTAGTHLLLVLFFAIAILFSRDHLRRSFEKILARYESIDAAQLLDTTSGVLEKFLLARVLLVIFVAVVDFVILKLFGISYAVSLSVLLGLTTLIPAIGFVLGILPPLAIAVAQGHSVIFDVGLFAALWAVSSVQDHVLTPKLIGRHLNLNFLITYIAIFAGEKLWGGWGMFLAIPVLGVMRVVFAEIPSLKPLSALIQEREEEVERQCPRS